MKYSLPDIEARWKTNSDALSRQMDEIVATRPKQDCLPSLRHQKALRSYWLTANQMLKDFTAYSHQTPNQLEPFPAILLLWMADLAESLGVGIVPDLVENCRSYGSARSPRNRHEVAKAVFFLLAVDDGRIQCSNPTTTVSNVFGVTKQTVRNWKRKADIICHGVEEPHPNVIEQAMIDAGYRHAIRRRSVSAEGAKLYAQWGLVPPAIDND